MHSVNVLLGQPFNLKKKLNPFIFRYQKKKKKKLDIVGIK